MIDAIIRWWDERRHGPLLFHSAGPRGTSAHYLDGYVRDIPKIPPPKIDKRWAQKQKLAAPSRFYGGDGTIHGTETVDIGVTTDGKVVSAWFRCQPLPFTWSRVTPERAEQMREMYRGSKLRLTGVEVLDERERA